MSQKSEETYTREELEGIVHCFECAIGLMYVVTSGDVAKMREIGQKYREAKEGLSDKARTYIEGKEKGSG